jgi:hypothetical protein
MHRSTQRPIRTLSAFARASWLVAPWLALAGCADDGLPCPGGCPAGQACDPALGQCVEVRPEVPADVGRWASAATDDAGRLWVAAYAGRYGDLVVAHERADGGLVYEYVDGLPPVQDGRIQQLPGVPLLLGDDVGLYASLALDGLGRPHVAYFDRTHGDLKYAYRSGEGWNLLRVPRAGDVGPGAVGRLCSLALDASGLPRIAYLGETTGALRLARKYADGRWAIEEIQACSPEQGWPGGLGGEVGRRVELVLDERGGEWIAFHDPCTGALRVASRLSEGWTTWDVDPGPGAGTWLAAALDPEGNLAVAYHDRRLGALVLARNQAGVLVRQVVDDGRQLTASGAVRQRPVGAHCALAFGADRRPRILYQDGATLDLWLVEGAADGTLVAPRQLDAEAPVGFFSDLAPGPLGLRAVCAHLGRDATGEAAGELRTYLLEDAGRGRGRP